MGLVLCHTADWHLGRTLHGASFEAAHRRFLAWLVELVAARSVDVLIVAGDVFDRSVPSASAEALFYGFLSELARAAPGVQVIVVAGNHDGPARLAAPAPMLAHLGAAARLPVRIVASLPITPGGEIDLDALLVPLETRSGEARGHLIAVPFLRPSDLSRAGIAADAGSIERARAIHAQLVAAAIAKRGARPGLLVATGHGQVRGARLSPDSERPLLGGEEAALPLDVFPRELDYVALGHLHLAQALDEGRVRYAGAPMPLAFSERAYPHQVVIASEREEGTRRRLEVEEVRAPRFVELVRVEGEGGAPLPLEDAITALGAVGAEPTDAAERWIQVRVRVPSPRAALKRELADALCGSAALAGPGAVVGSGARLVSVEIVRDIDAMHLPRSTSVREELAPEAVLHRVWSSVSREPVPEALTRALAEAWQVAQEERDADLAVEPDVSGDLAGLERKSGLGVAS